MWKLYITLKKCVNIYADTRLFCLTVNFIERNISKIGLGAKMTIVFDYVIILITLRAQVLVRLSPLALPGG